MGTALMAPETWGTLFPSNVTMGDRIIQYYFKECSG